MQTESGIDQVFSDVLVDNTAQTVFKRLSKLKNARERFKLRWIWELLQNASDAAGPEGVNISITISGSELEFSHNGLPFGVKQVGHLIYHGSTKQEDEDSAGQFGTGFITTHLISELVRVEGKLDDGRSFKFLLRREGNSADELRENMHASRDEFKKSLSKTSSDEEFPTRFTYEIEDAVRPDVETAIENLRSYLPYVLAFNAKIREVRLTEMATSVTISKGPPELLDDGFVKYPIVTHSNGSEAGIYVVCSVPESLVQVGFLLLPGESGPKISIESETPRLFVFFPLLGTESFTFPVAVNCSDFVPTEDRDGIFLWMGDSDSNRQNEDLVRQAIHAFLRIAQLPNKYAWDNTYQLARLAPLVQTEWLGVESYRKLLKEDLLNSLRGIPLLATSNSKQLLIEPKKALIPLAEGQVSATEVWGVAASLKSREEFLPREADVENWAEILSDWALLKGCSPTSFDESLSLEALAEIVNEFETIEELKADLAEGLNAFDWLNTIFELICRADLEHLFDTLAILPNQVGELCSRNDLFYDDEIDDELKVISDGLDIPGRSELLAKEITCESVIEFLQSSSSGDLRDECITAVKRISKSPDTDRESFVNSNAKLLAWCINNEAFAELDSYPVLTRKTEPTLPDCVIQLDSRVALTGDIPVFPTYAWNEKARPFVEIFPEQFLVSDEYEAWIGEVQWQKMADKALVRNALVFSKKENVNSFVEHDQIVISDEKNKIESKQPVELRQIAFLTNPSFGIIERIRKNRERAAKFLEFVLCCLIDDGKAAFETGTVKCTDDKDHEYFKSDWMTVLANRSWVPVKQRSERATPESLGNLIRGRSQIIDQLGDPLPKQFFKAIGVGMADLSLHIIADNEESRISLMGSFSEMVRAAEGDTDRIRRVANELGKSPHLLDKIEQHTQTRERVEKNQSIGRIVEELLSSALGSTGLKVTRTGIGSDFEAENDLVVQEQEQAIQVTGKKNSVLIEIKSARADKVGMTITQAKMAVSEKKRFMLCVVVVDSTDELTEEIVKQNSFFVADIGKRLSKAVNGFEQFEKTQSSTRRLVTEEKIEIDIGESQTRFRIPVELARTSGLGFEETVEHIRAKCLRKS